MEKMNYVSVIIPAYNAEKYIAETIKSAIKQTYQPVEIIVVDDGSNDQTTDIAEQFGGIVKVIKQKNSGVSAARNHAAKIAKGNWLAFLDSDDIWLSNKLETQLKNINGNLWSHTNSLYIGENQDGKTSRSDLSSQFGGEIFRYLLVDNFITTSTVVMEKSLFFRFGGFDEKMSAMEDWKLWLVIAQHEPIAYCSDILAKYRVYSGSTSRKARVVLPIHIDLINSIFSEDYTKKHFGNLRYRALSQSYSICSYIAEDSDDQFFAFKCAIKAFFYQPYKYNRLRRVLSTIAKLL